MDFDFSWAFLWCNMNNKSKITETFYKISYLLIAFGVFLAFFGIYNPYSYWFDELFSVIASSSNVSTLFTNFILPDVHPPLYQLVLKGWILLFSDSEISTRLLSLLFSYLAFFVIMFWGRRKLPKLALITTLIFFSTNNLFIYYSQETRAYSMMLFFATVVTILFINNITYDEIQPKYLLYILVVLIMLSLTHYFGLVYTGIILIYLLFLNVSKKKYQNTGMILITGILCMVWPVCHFLYGNITSKMGGHFWIESKGWQNTTEVASNAIFPQISKGLSKFFSITNQHITTIIFIILLAAIFFFAYMKSKKENNLPYTNDSSKAAKGIIILIVSFLVLIILIDLHSPMSTTRNFIVLLPAVSIVIGIAANNFFNINKPFVYLLLLILAVSNIYLFTNRYSSATGRVPTQNYKEASRYMVECKESKDYNFYYIERQSGFRKLNYNRARFYIDRLYSENEIIIKGVTIEELFFLEKPYLLLIQHNQEAYYSIIEKLKYESIDFKSYIPEQRVLGAVVICVD